MSQAIATVEQHAPAAWNAQETDLIKKQIAPDCSDLELQLFAKVCQRTGLDPFTHQIYAIKRGNKMTIQTGIDGYRLMAARTGELAGIDDAEYDAEDADHPAWARVTVWRLTHGVRCPFTAKVRWSEYAGKNKDGNLTDMWKRMPYLMLGKCAEALALRKAFPAELSGVYTAEEMDQADYVDAPPASATTARQTTHAAPRLSSARQRKSEATLKTEIAELCKEHGITQEALSAWMNWPSNRYSSKVYNHLEEMLQRLRTEPDALAGLQLQNLALHHLLTIESLVAIIRRRSGDQFKNYQDCWAAVSHTEEAQQEWDQVIREEIAQSAA